MKLKQNLTLVSLALAMWCTGAASAEQDKPWMDTHRPAAERAKLAVQAMTLDEKLKLVYGYLGADFKEKHSTRPAESHKQSAGFVYGVPRLGTHRVDPATIAAGRDGLHRRTGVVRNAQHRRCIDRGDADARPSPDPQQRRRTLFRQQAYD